MEEILGSMGEVLGFTLALGTTAGAIPVLARLVAWGCAAETLCRRLHLGAP